MRLTVIGLILCSLLFAGCDLQQIKDAAAGINKQANQASIAISEEVHSLRAIEITYNDKTFTINDLYKSILRDVYWYYEQAEEMDVLTVKGTWQPELLLQDNLLLENYPELDVIGEVHVQLFVLDGKISEEKTSLQVIYEDNIIVNESGTSILHKLYDIYTQ